MPSIHVPSPACPLPFLPPPCPSTSLSPTKKVEKKRKIHAFKSKQRMEMLEVMTNKKQNTWQQFQTKGIKKKAGFLTGRKKESIFKSPEDVGGKVGVVGSGQGMTDFQKRDKNLNLRAQGQAEED
ncbi:unnamed protein product [Closterium sp. NIES-53]